MPEPTVSESTRLWFSRLPDYLQATDEKDTSTDGWPLLRFLSLLGDQFGELHDLVQRMDYVPPDEPGYIPGDTSDLVDPLTADASWLAWVAQLVGVRLDRSLSVDSQRAQILGSGAGWLSGTPQALATLAASQLTGSKYVRIIDHYAGDQWSIGIRTRDSETPDAPAMLAACLPAKPAGYVLVSDLFDTPWDTLEGAYPTWDDWEAAGSWTAIAETGAP